LKRRVVIRLEARAELSEAAAWYRSKSPVVAATFRTDVRETINRISEWPDAFTEISLGIRRALTSQFPYAIFFANEPRGVVILAIKHQAQDPASWPRSL
jgi:plasmid stabilization system protein ParE